jgi:signal transduction histidine kinase
MNMPNYSLRAALLAFVLLPLFSVMGLGGWQILRNVENGIEARMKEDIELVARAIRLPLSYAMERGRDRSVSRAIASVFRIGRVYGAYVYDAEGRRIAASGAHRPAVASDRAAALASVGDRQGGFEEVGGEKVYSYFVPLTDSGGRIIGLLQVTRRGLDFREDIVRTRVQALGLLFLTAVLLTTVMLYGHHRAIGGHLRKLNEGMARVGGGEREHRLSLRGPREVQEVATGVNRMLDNLAHQERTLLDQRSHQAALRQRLRHSEQMAAIGRLAAGVAHELGTPLQVLDGNAQRVLRLPGVPPRATDALRAMRGEVQRMARIVRQLLDIGRSNPLERRAVSAERLLREACAALAETSRDLGIGVELRTAANAPTLTVDRTRFGQALENLMRNALQAASRRVRVAWFETDDAIGFTVDDDGSGVADDDKPRIFEPFFTTKSVRDGTGLGLAVAHAAVSDHGGVIRVGESGWGGARFQILVPKPGTAGETDA